MNEPSMQTNDRNPYGCAGMAALLFFASPTIAFGMVAMVEFLQRRGKPASGGPVGIAAPPIWYVWLVVLLIALPWFLAGVLLLRRNRSGRWIAIVLTIPSALIAALTGIGAMVGLNTRDSMATMNACLFGPISLGAMLFCMTLWITEYANLGHSKSPYDSQSNS